MGPNANLSLQPADLSITKNAENCRLTAFIPVPGDPWTIGWGHTSPDVHEGLVWTQFKADSQLLIDMSSAEQTVRDGVNIPLTREEYIALCDFVYNVGSGNFLGSTLRRLLNSGDILGASQQFLQWTKAHGVVLQGLINRRNAEMAEFLLGADFTVQVPTPATPIAS